MLPLLITLQTFVWDVQHRFSREEKGATAVEYGLIVGLIAVVLIASVTLLGGNLSSLFDRIGTKVTGITP